MKSKSNNLVSQVLDVLGRLRDSPAEHETLDDLAQRHGGRAALALAWLHCADCERLERLIQERQRQEQALHAAVKRSDLTHSEVARLHQWITAERRQLEQQLQKELQLCRHDATRGGDWHG